MKRFMLACTLASGLGLLAAGQRAQAQVQLPGPPQNPYIQPPVSPFLNINRGGNAAINYFGIVQPQIQTVQQLQALQFQQAQMMQMGIGTTDMTALGGMSATGHPSQFFNYGHYYGPPGGNVRPAAPMVSGIGVRRQ
jgi:hypothetical protein